MLCKIYIRMHYFFLYFRAYYTQKKKQHQRTKPISVRVDRASGTEMGDLGSIPAQQKTTNIGIHSFSARSSALKGTV